MKSQALMTALTLLVPLTAGAADVSPNFFPAGATAGLRMNLERGIFEFAPDTAEIEWVNSVVTKDAAGALKITGVVAGKVGILGGESEGAICSGDEKTNPLAKPELLENGKLSMNKVRLQSYKRALAECQAEGGAPLMDGDRAAIVHAHSQVQGSEAENSRKCFAAEIQIKCDLSARANEIKELYQKFRTEFPAHPFANDIDYDALR
jgi:hypothetical protein